MNEWGSVLFFKQKTAYEMRISDWSSDVVSADLATKGGVTRCPPASLSCRAVASIFGRTSAMRPSCTAMSCPLSPEGRVALRTMRSSMDLSLAFTERHQQRLRIGRAARHDDHRQDAQHVRHHEEELVGDDGRRRLLQADLQSLEGRAGEEHTSELQSLMRNSYAVF